jgi:hypothetical protein
MNRFAAGSEPSYCCWHNIYYLIGTRLIGIFVPIESEIDENRMSSLLLSYLVSPIQSDHS